MVFVLGLREQDKFPCFDCGNGQKGPALCLDFQRGAAFYTFQKGPALYLHFPRGSAIQTFQTFQKGPSLYLAFVFADASTSPSSSPMPATCGSSPLHASRHFFLFPPPGSPPPTLFGLDSFFCMSWVAW
ncbi:unnamed protein product [Boreogadus saida]